MLGLTLLYKGPLASLYALCTFAFWILVSCSHCSVLSSDFAYASLLLKFPIPLFVSRTLSISLIVI